MELGNVFQKDPERGYGYGGETFTSFGELYCQGGRRGGFDIFCQ